MKLLGRYLHPLGPMIALTVAIKIFATFLELLLPYILSHILDNVVPRESVRQILIWGGVMILAAVGAFLCNVIANRRAVRVARDTVKDLRHDLFEATMYLTARETDDFTIPSLESRLTSDTYNVRHFVATVMRLGVRAPMLLIGGIVVTLVLDRHLALVLIATLPLITAATFLIAHRGLPLYRRAQKNVDGMVREVREACQGVRVMKALSREEYAKGRFDEANRALAVSERRAGVTMAASQPLVNLFLNAGLVCVIAFGAYWVGRGLSEPGRIIAFMQYFTLMSFAVSHLPRIFTEFSKCMASAGRIEEVFEVYRAHAPEETTAIAEKNGAGGEGIVFEDVCFSYNGRADNLSHVSFTLPRGATLGVIGATGSGKTTLAQLLMRFYPVDSGRILIDGRDVRDYDERELRSRFGVVMQNDFIVADTVAENIRFGREISDEQMRRAARLAQAEDFINAFPEGFDHLLTSKGTNVSGGQRQRILIARALAGAPDILILDDASSALDYRTDARLRAAIRDELRGPDGRAVTTVMVAQRVSSVMHADHILVLDEGRVLAAGRHEELLATCPTYREISESQMGGAFLD